MDTVKRSLGPLFFRYLVLWRLGFKTTGSFERRNERTKDRGEPRDRDAWPLFIMQSLIRIDWSMRVFRWDWPHQVMRGPSGPYWWKPVTACDSKSKNWPSALDIPELR